MSNIAIIPARGGSKRIPRKNVKEFFGKPIIAYSIEAALKSKLFSEVMVSTDDEEIAAIAISYGAKVPFLRSIQTADDYATTADVVLEVIKEYKFRKNTFEWLCCLYPTAPFVTSEKLLQSFDKVKVGNYDGLLPVLEYSSPPQRALIVSEQGSIDYKWPENINKRSQDLQKFYYDAGQFYILKVERFLQEKKMVLSRTVPHILKELEVQDIDNISDWEIAEFKYSMLQNIKGLK